MYVCLRTHTQTNTRDKQVIYRYSFLLVKLQQGKAEAGKGYFSKPVRFADDRGDHVLRKQ